MQSKNQTDRTISPNDAAIFLVCLFPENISRWVSDIRANLDPEVALLPPEITLCGSSGISVLNPNTDAREITNALKTLENLRMPKLISFEGVRTFPNTEIRWLGV